MFNSMITKISAHTKAKNIHSSGPKAAFSYTQETTLKPPACEVPSHPQSTESHLLPLTSASATGARGSWQQLSTCQMKHRCPGTATHTHTCQILHPRQVPSVPVRAGLARTGCGETVPTAELDSIQCLFWH